MRHRIAGKKLNRAVKPRQALFRLLIASLIKHGRLEITLTKAKAIRPLIDKLVTKAKKSSLTARRQVQAFLQNQELTQKLILSLAPNFKRNSGYVKITRLPVKRSDAVPMARIEWSEKINPPTGREKVDNKETKRKETPKRKTLPKAGRKNTK